MIKKFLQRMLEEVCPIPHFMLWNIKKRKKAVEICNGNKDKDEKLLEELPEITPDEIATRLNEEHERGRALDKKTYKITTVISIGVTIVGILTTQVLKVVDNATIIELLKILIQIAILYGIAASFISIGAIRTLPQYGFGTEFIKSIKRDDLTALKNLKAQEQINIIRQMRNECAYMLLRNSYYIIIFVYLFLFIYTIYSAGAKSSPHPNVFPGIHCTQV